MTVCVGAITDNSNAIVCVADKSANYGQDLQWDSGASKMLEVGDTGIHVLISGDDALCQELLTRLALSPDFSNGDIRKSMQEAKQHFQDLQDETIVDIVLRPNLLDKTAYLELLRSDSVTSEYVKGIARKVSEFEFECDLMFCGFDGNEKPFIQALVSPGKIVDATHSGFYAIGSGWEKAISRLLFQDYEKGDSLQKCLYDAFDAKVTAEMVPTVGYEWDAKILIKGRRGCVLDKLHKEMLETLWGKINGSPFGRDEEEIKLKGGAKTWIKELAAYAESLKSTP